jgi:uncharacterized protein
VMAYGTVGRPWIEYLLTNLRSQETMDGRDELETEERLRDVEHFWHLLTVERLTLAQIRERAPELAARMKPEVHLFGRSPGFYQQLAALRIPAAWRQLTAPSLLLWGTSDFVSAGDDHRLIAAAVNRAAPGRSRFEELPHVDHGLARAETPRASQTRTDAGTYAPSAADAVERWIRTQLARPAPAAAR